MYISILYIQHFFWLAVSKVGSTRNVLESPTLLDIEVFFVKIGKILQYRHQMRRCGHNQHVHATSPLTAGCDDVLLTQEEGRSSVSVRDTGQDIGDESQ